MTSLLRVHCTILEVVESGDEVVAAIGDLRPDVVVLDLCLPGQSSLQLLPELRRKYRRNGTVMSTSHDEPGHIGHAFTEE